MGDPKESGQKVRRGSAWSSERKPPRAEREGSSGKASLPTSDGRRESVRVEPGHEAGDSAPGSLTTGSFRGAATDLDLEIDGRGGALATVGPIGDVAPEPVAAPEPGWLKYSGPIATVCAIPVLELTSWHVQAFPLPGVLLTLAVIFSAFRGGRGPGLIAAAMAVAYGAHLLWRQSAGVAGVPELAGFAAFAVMIFAAVFVASSLSRRLRQLAMKDREATAKAEVAARRARFLSDAGALLDASMGYQAAQNTLVRLCVPALGDWCVSFALEPADGGMRRAVVAHVDRAQESRLRRVLPSEPFEVGERALLREVVGSGDPRVVEGAEAIAAALGLSREHLASLIDEFSPRAALVVPLVTRGRVLGVIVLVSEMRDRGYAADEIELAVELARLAAPTLDTAKLYETALAARTEAEASRKRITNILESIADGFIALDQHWRFTYINGEAERMLRRDRDQLLGRSIWEEYPELVGSTSFREYHRAAVQQVPIEFEGLSFLADSWLETRVYPSRDGLSVCFRDVTKRKEVEEALRHSEEQLRQAQKMEAVGRLAGGIAHDFNNLLTAIQGHAELLLEEADPSSPKRADVEEIWKASERAAALTRQLLAFSRQQVSQPKLLNVNEVVNNIGLMLGRLIGEDVDLVMLPAPDLGCVMADPGQIEQILMNLAVNARDAMPRGGRLTIETSNVELAGDFAHRFAYDLKPGRYVMISVTDTGVGMDKEVQRRIFEPFFTTKEKGKGTGLGLSTVYGIVQQSGGYIWVDSRLGQGTSFKIYLPRVRDIPADAGPATPLTRSAAGSETILVVEDESAVRSLICKTLRKSGYNVLEAENGRDALRAASEHSGPLHLVLTDVVMPEMGGKELSERLAVSRPDTRILFISGYAESEIVHNGVLKPGTVFLEKPFTPDSLSRKVREVLDKAQHRGEPDN